MGSAGAIARVHEPVEPRGTMGTSHLSNLSNRRTCRTLIRSQRMSDARAILQNIAHRAMIDYGLQPELPADAEAEVRDLGAAPLAGLRDLRELPWSSIDNDDSRDLDQLEVVIEATGMARLLIAVADVDSLVPKGSALDEHARINTTSVYTPARVFPMLPEALSTDRTSLNESEDRPALVVDMAVGDDGTVTQSDVYRAAVRNHARLTYDGVAAWLDGHGPAPAGIGQVDRPRAPAADPGSPGRVPPHAARGRRRARLRPHRDQAGDGRRRSQGPAGRRLEPRPRHDRELHDRRQRRHRPVPDLAGLGLDPARRAGAGTVAAHRRDRRRARHHAAGRARRRRA